MENLMLYQKRLISSLQLLALPYPEQQDCFEDFVDKPFEILDTFDNAFLHLPKLIESEIFSYQVIADLLRLHNLINFTSSDLKFKDLEVEQFGLSDEWNKVRLFSKEILQLMAEPIEKPDLNYI